MNQGLGLLAVPALRTARREEKRRAVLRFLRQHLWSTQDVLSQVLRVESRQAAHKSLLALEAEGILRRHRVEALAGSVTLWGITPHGQALAFELDSESPVSAYFEPGRVSEQTIRHQLDLQRLRLAAEAAGWTDWTDGDRLGDLGKNAKRPDAIAVDPQGRRSAIECERTIKTTKRYERILVSYLRAARTKAIDRVVWVSPSEDFARRLRIIVTGIRSVTIAGQQVAIDPERHHRLLTFAHYGAWPRV
jgi:hypothetical protein